MVNIYYNIDNFLIVLPFLNFIKLDQSLNNLCKMK